MANSPQEIYDSIKILNGTIKDKKDEIKNAEDADSKIAAARDAIDDLKVQMKDLKKAEKIAKDVFKNKNSNLYESLDSLKKQKQGGNERLVVAMVKNLKNDVQTEIWDENGGSKKRVQVDFEAKMKKV